MSEVDAGRLKPGMVVTVRFTNTHAVTGRVGEVTDATIQIDRGYWKRCMVERIFRDAAVTRAHNLANPTGRRAQ